MAPRRPEPSATIAAESPQRGGPASGAERAEREVPVTRLPMKMSPMEVREEQERCRRNREKEVSANGSKQSDERHSKLTSLRNQFHKDVSNLFAGVEGNNKKEKKENERKGWVALRDLQQKYFTYSEEKLEALMDMIVELDEKYTILKDDFARKKDELGEPMRRGRKPKHSAR